MPDATRGANGRGLSRRAAEAATASSLCGRSVLALSTVGLARVNAVQAIRAAMSPVVTLAEERWPAGPIPKIATARCKVA